MHGLYLLWWVQEKGIPAPIVATILAAGDLALMVLEVPTGWLADRFGHRASLIAGSFAQILGMLLCWLGDGIGGLIAASVLVALGDAFRSGADQALLYRTCQALGCEEAFQRIEARARAIQIAALVGLVLAGGAIVKAWGFDVGWAVETALCAVGLAIAFSMTEPPSAVSDARVSSRGHATISWSMALLILPASLLGGAAGAASFLAQTAGRGDPEGVTMLVAGDYVGRSCGLCAGGRCSGVGIRGQATLAALGAALMGGPLLPLVSLGRRRAVFSRRGRHSAAGRRDSAASGRRRTRTRGFCRERVRHGVFDDRPATRRILASNTITA